MRILARPAMLVSTFDARQIAPLITQLRSLFGKLSRTEILAGDQIMEQVMSAQSLMSTNSAGVNILLVRPSDWTLGETGHSLEESVASAQAFIRLLTARAESSQIPWLLVLFPSLGTRSFADALDSQWWAAVTGVRVEPYLEFVNSTQDAVNFGIAEVRDAEKERFSAVPYARTFLARVAYTIVRFITKWSMRTLKVIAVDCDNTLWIGRCGEDPGGLSIDAGRRSFHFFLERKRQEGFLLAMVSRNSREDVDDALKRLSDKGIRFPQFDIKRIGWNSKSSSLKDISRVFNIGLEHFAMFDDDQIECAEVRANTDLALVVSIPTATDQAVKFLENYWAFDSTTVTSTDIRRSALYTDDAARAELQRSVPSLAEFIASLNLIIRITAASRADATRIVQILHRTTQFNTTSLDHTSATFERLLQDPNRECLVCHASDRFGDYGLVGAVILSYQDPMTIEAFVLSCRAFHRGIEDRLLEEVMRRARSRSIDAVEMPFKPTTRNVPAIAFINRLSETLPPTAMWMNSTQATFYPNRIPEAFANTDEYCNKYRPLLDISVQPNSERRYSDTLDTDHKSPFDFIASELATPASLADWLFEDAGVVPLSHKADADSEAVLRDLWERAIGYSDFEGHEDFFDLAADSLAAIRMLQRIEDELGVEIEVSTIFMETFSFERLKALYFSSRSSR